MSTTTAPAPAESQKATAEETVAWLEAAGEFDHGVDAFAGDGLHGGASAPPAPPEMHLPDIKPKEMFIKAEKAVKGVIRSVGQKVELGAESERTTEETIAYLEAAEEFDHGVALSCGDVIHSGSPSKAAGNKDHPPAPQMHLPDIKPKEMFVKAEKAVEGVIRSVGQKMGSARKVAAESGLRDKVEQHTVEETAAGKMSVKKDIHKESFEAPC